MSEQIEDGGPAFPLFADGNAAYHTASIANDGMSLRDWLAGQAMVGLLAANATYGGKTDNREALAGDAYATADAMIAARTKQESGE